MTSLYDHPLPSTRVGSIFNAHSYPTKINAAAVMACILAHTKPGDLVYDGFAGSGVTGLAATLCEHPSPEVQESIQAVLGDVAWGARDCELYDISQLAAFIGGTLLNPPDPTAFDRAAREVLAELEATWGWMYAAEPGALRHLIWTDHPLCPHCNHASSFWDLAVTLNPLQMNSRATCPSCNQAFDLTKAARLTERFYDELLGQECERRVRTPAFAYGRSGSTTWRREAQDGDLALLARIAATPIPAGVPVVPMLQGNGGPWGELYRSGYHFGMTHMHHFYTRRNLIAVAAAWAMVERYPLELRPALRFWISSYNASHSTLMSRVVCKKNATDFVVTGAQPAALYISSLPVEKNVFAGMRKKLKAISEAFATLGGRKNRARVTCASSLKVDLADGVVDYIFTDPPFGNNIQYAEVNFISEAWLGQVTDQREEAIVSPFQEKSVQGYEALLAGAFRENFRILKPGRFMTVAFHSTSPDVWNALRSAWEGAGFVLVRTSILAKTQGSFKQVTTDGAVQGDPLVLLQKPGTSEECQAMQADELPIDPWSFVAERLATLPHGSDERDRQRLFSRFIGHCLEQSLPVPLDAKSFFAALDERFQLVDDRYFLPGNQDLEGELARTELTQLTTDAHRKQYGQYFTPPTVAALASAFAIQSPTDSVLDPMCGTGSMLWAAQDRLAHLGAAPGDTQVVGVEVDSQVAKVAALPPTARSNANVRVLGADAFTYLSGLTGNREHLGHYDAIVGNPPYVRYQSLAPLLDYADPALVEAFRTLLPKEPDTVLASTLIRTSLIAHLLPPGAQEPATMAKAALTLLQGRNLPADLDPVQACWLKLVAGYSGLADLSLPSWLLTWQLAKPGATIAYVTTASWKNRQYARLLQYFMLRMLQPLYVVEQEGNTWFGDAQVSTSLMIFRVRPAAEIAVPLGSRTPTGHQVRVIRVKREHDLADPATFQRIATTLSGKALNPGDLAGQAALIVKAMDRKSDLWSMQTVPEQTLVDSLLQEDRAARRVRSGGISLGEIEGEQTATGSTPASGNLPYGLCQALGLQWLPHKGFRFPSDYGVEVNQGLRTGCNPFFYVERPQEADLTRWLPGRDPAEIETVLANPSRHPEGYQDLVAALRQVSPYIPTEAPDLSPPSMLVKLADELGGAPGVFPLAYLRPVIRYQQGLTRWGPPALDRLPDLALVTGTGAHPSDFAEVQTTYPAAWRQVWGLTPLPSGLAAYVETASRMELTRNGRTVPIPQLTAVAPNVRRPHGRPVKTTPAPPAWWYTLPILPRHTGSVYMGRIHQYAPTALLNSTGTPALIDANFTTFTANLDTFPAAALFAVLNSDWVKAFLEMTATPMGGGALKVEAAHLRSLPIPAFSPDEIAELTGLGESLAEHGREENTADIHGEINRVVAARLGKVLGLSPNRITQSLANVVSEYGARRKR